MPVVLMNGKPSRKKARAIRGPDDTNRRTRLSLCAAAGFRAVSARTVNGQETANYVNEITVCGLVRQLLEQAVRGFEGVAADHAAGAEGHDGEGRRGAEAGPPRGSEGPRMQETIDAIGQIHRVDAEGDGERRCCGRLAETRHANQ